jgi:hypothetical protein
MTEALAHAQTHPDSEMDDVVAKDTNTPGFALTDPGRINSAVLHALAARITPEILADRVYRLIHAKRKLKNGQEEDDVRANEAGLKLALAYQVGKPIERAQIVTQNVPADDHTDFATRVDRSPALRRMLRKMLDRHQAD